MNNNKRVAIFIAASFIIGVAAGQLVSRSHAPAVEAQAAVAPSAHGDMQNAPPQDGACTMDCAKDRPELEARLQKDPNDIEALIALGACDLDMGQPQQGIDRLGRAVVLSKDARQLVQAGVSLARAAETEKAFAAFEKALIADPKDSEALYRAGLLAFHNMGDKGRAVKYWRKYLEVAPQAANAEIIKRAIDQLASEERGG